MVPARLTMAMNMIIMQLIQQPKLNGKVILNSRQYMHKQREGITGVQLPVGFPHYISSLLKCVRAQK